MGFRENKQLGGLPEGAKLDYSDDVKELHDKISVGVAKYFKRANKLIADNTDLAEKMRETLKAQQEVFASVGIRLGEANPIVKNLKDKLSGIDELAELSRMSEIKDCTALGFVPEDGWELAFLRFEAAAKKQTTAGEITKILLNNSEKKSKSVSTNKAAKAHTEEAVQSDSASSKKTNGAKDCAKLKPSAAFKKLKI